MLQIRRLVTLFTFITVGCVQIVQDVSNAQVPDSAPITEELTLDRLERDTFKYFWETTDENTGLAPDRYPTESPASIAAIGFALTSYPIGVEKGFIKRKQAVKRTISTLRFLWSLPLGAGAKDVAGYQGFFYHFLNMSDGLRHQGWEVELSTVDTALLMGGVLLSQSYFDGDSKDEIEIRELSDKLYRRVNWQWAQNNDPLISLGWYPDKGFINYDWVGYNEAMLVYILALGSPTYSIEPEAWEKWSDHYKDDWGGNNEFKHLSFAPMFGHQYSHIWIDFRGIQDAYMKEKDSDYFINSTMATYSQRQYAIANPSRWDGYSKDIWGITASDGPGKFHKVFKGTRREFRGYSARGVAVNHSFDDGTLAPTALAGSLPFAPEIVLPALKQTFNLYGDYIYKKYGFIDAYNPSFKYEITVENGTIIPDVGWVGKDYIGIDQGPILTMSENYRTGLIWKVMRNNPYVKRGLIRAGFTGGWLDREPINVK